MHLPENESPEKESPSGNHDKEGQAAVASFRTWRGLPAFNPWPLTEARKVAGTLTGRKMKVWKNLGKPLANQNERRLKGRPLAGRSTHAAPVTI
jgi:hypothetical protein